MKGIAARTADYINNSSFLFVYFSSHQLNNISCLQTTKLTFQGSSSALSKEDLPNICWYLR